MSHHIYNQNSTYFLTLSIIEWIDIFTRPDYKEIIVDALNYCSEHKGLEIFGWVLMSNHLHMIARAEEGARLSDLLRDFKRHTSKKMYEAIQDLPESRRNWMNWMFETAGRRNRCNEHFQIWQNGNCPIEISSTRFFLQKLNYIHNNPVKAQIVGSGEEYLHSSAGDYGGLGDGLVRVSVNQVYV